MRSRMMSSDHRSPKISSETATGHPERCLSLAARFGTAKKANRINLQIASYWVVKLCVRPQPSKRATGNAAVDQAVENVFAGDPPGLAAPDGLLRLRRAISEEGGRAGNAKHFEV